MIVVRSASTCAVFAVILCGCARYEYVLLAPGEQQQLIGREKLVVPFEPLEYRLARRDSRLLIRIINPTDEAVMLAEVKSYLVDSDGQTHPLGYGIIAPHAHVDLLLPPSPRVYRLRAPWGYYHPWGYGAWPRYHHPFHYPRTYYVTEYPANYWEWRTGTVRLHLAYRQGQREFKHELRFLRRRI